MLKAMEDVTQTYGPSPHVKLVLDRLFTALLNYADLAMDMLVMMEYGCFMHSSISNACEIEVDSSSNITINTEISTAPGACQPHWWWFGLSLTILVVSTLLQACIYNGSHSQPNCALFFIGIFQLTYVRDVWIALMDPEKAESEVEMKSSRNRDTWVKVFECMPQLYLQSYILFATESHRDQLKVLSTMTSAASLAFGLVKNLNRNPLLRQVPVTWLKKVAVGLFYMTDQLLRASAYALILSEAARPVGIPLIIFFAMVAWFISYKALGKGGLAGVIGTSLGVLAGFFAPIAGFLFTVTGCLPALEGPDGWKQLLRWSALPLRSLEMISCGVVGLTMAKTACGGQPVTEVLMFFGLFLGNLAIGAVAILCMEWKAPDDDTASVSMTDVPDMPVTGPPPPLPSERISVDMGRSYIKDTE